MSLSAGVCCALPLKPPFAALASSPGASLSRLTASRVLSSGSAANRPAEETSGQENSTGSGTQRAQAARFQGTAVRAGLERDLGHGRVASCGTVG